MRIISCILSGLLCLSPWVIACSNADFESVTEVSKPRILDIVESPVGMAPNEDWTAEPVIAFPSIFEDELFVEQQLCIFDQGAQNYYRCVEELPIPFPNILAESTGETFAFSQSLLSNEELHEVCDILAGKSDTLDIPPAVLGSLPQCTIGLPVQLRVKMCRDAPGCADEDAVIVRKITHLLFEESAQRSDRNTNPMLHGITFDEQPWAENTPLTVVLRAEKEEFELKIEADLSESAQFFTPWDDPEEAPVREELETRWFASTAGISSSRRYYRDGITRDDEFKENKITLDPDRLEDGERIDLWVILRDSRLGSDVMRRQIIIQKQ